MSKRKEPHISVTLQESHWLAILDIIRQISQKRGGEWLSWGRHIASVIENGVRRASERGGMPSTVAIDGDRAGPVCPRDGAAVDSEIDGQRRVVVIRRERAQAMIAAGRQGRVMPESSWLRFNIQTARQFRAGERPAYGYEGWLMIEGHHIVDGQCSCPDWQEGRATLPNGVTFCKHLGWAELKVKRGEVQPDGRITLVLGWDGQCEKLVAIWENGSVHEPGKCETPAVVRGSLVKRGFHLDKTVIMRDQTIHQVYVREER